MKKLPKKVEILTNKTFNIILEEDLPHLGYWDEGTTDIYIKKNESLYNQWITLCHEILHILDEELILAGKKKITFTEKSIEFGSSALIGFLVMNDLVDFVPKNTISKTELKGKLF